MKTPLKNQLQNDFSPKTNTEMEPKVDLLQKSPQHVLFSPQKGKVRIDDLEQL